MSQPAPIPLSTAPIPLPTRRSKEAPRFDRKDPLSLWDYFCDYEILAQAAQLDQRTKIHRSVLYLDRDDAEYWQCLREYSSEEANWEAFKRAVLESYPGSIPQDRWRYDDLTQLCEVQQTKRITTREQFAEFDRAFTTISTALIRKGQLSELEAKRLYWNALDPSFRHKVERRIEIEIREYTPDVIPDIPPIRKAANHVLAADQANARSSPPELPSNAEVFNFEAFAKQMEMMMSHMVESVATAVLRRVSLANQAVMQPRELAAVLTRLAAVTPTLAGPVVEGTDSEDPSERSVLTGSSNGRKGRLVR